MVKNTAFKGAISLFAILFLIWWLLNFPLDKENFAAGLIVCLFLSFYFGKKFSQLKIPFSLPRVFFALIYFFVLFWEIIKANLDVAWRLLHPKMPIKPGIVEIKTKLKSDFAKVALANSITLTPGTFTLDILDDSLLIHWINVKTDDKNKAGEIIAGRFEKFLKLIFE